MNPALVYFDIFDYPLTWLELERLELSPSPFPASSAGGQGEGRPALRSLGEGGVRVEERNGFYFLPGREEIISTRQQRYVIAQRKFKRALRVAKFLARLPFVRMLAVCNSLAYSNARQGSDIDLFVITSAGGAWWARFLSLLILKILRLRPGQGGVKDKICLSFFVDEYNLDLSRLRLGDDDIYFIYWLATLYPIYDAGAYYQKLWQANESWLKRDLPSVWPTLPHPARIIKINAFSIFLKNIFERILLPFVGWIEKLQIKLLPPAFKAKLNQDTRVRVERGVLKFHTNDRRELYAREFTKRCNFILGANHEAISHKP